MKKIMSSDMVFFFSRNLICFTMKAERRKHMSTIQLIKGSCADQDVDVVVNAANRSLMAGGGICGVIFAKCGYEELTQACQAYSIPRNDGDAVITDSFHMHNCKAIIHAVGPDFRVDPNAFDALFDAYYNSLLVMKENGYNRISFPLISSGIFSGNLDYPVYVSATQCVKAYESFIQNDDSYEIDVLLCAFTQNEYVEASHVFSFLEKE